MSRTLYLNPHNSRPFKICFSLSLLRAHAPNHGRRGLSTLCRNQRHHRSTTRHVTFHLSTPTASLIRTSPRSIVSSDNSTTSTSPPPTPSQESTPYVLTLIFPPSVQYPLSDLRRSYFPSSHPGYQLPAHLTLFHALPGAHLPALTAHIEQTCADTKPFRLRFHSQGATLVGKPFKPTGVALHTGHGGNNVRALRQLLLNGFLRLERVAAGEEQPQAWFTAQDRLSDRSDGASRRKGGWRGHVTVTNKLAIGEKDGRLLARKVKWIAGEVRERFRECEGVIEGVRLWRFEGAGKWGFERDFGLGGGEEEKGKEGDAEGESGEEVEEGLLKRA